MKQNNLHWQVRWPAITPSLKTRPMGILENVVVTLSKILDN